jgi:hypothetical protein
MDKDRDANIDNGAVFFDVTKYAIAGMIVGGLLAGGMLTTKYFLSRVSSMENSDISTILANYAFWGATIATLIATYNFAREKQIKTSEAVSISSLVISVASIIETTLILGLTWNELRGNRPFFSSEQPLRDILVPIATIVVVGIEGAIGGAIGGYLVTKLGYRFSKS